MAAKRLFQRVRVDPLQDQPQARVRRRITQAQIECVVETRAMGANEFMQLPIGLGARDHAEDRVEQHRRQLGPPPLPPPMIRD
jgi:hypothetical protein